MRQCRFLVWTLIVAMLSAGGASAATTVFADSVVSTAGVTSAETNILGASDGATGRIGAFLFSTGEVTLGFSDAISGADLAFTTVNSFGSTNVFVSIGETVGGVAVFSAESSFVETSGGVFNLDLSAACSGISASGCSLLRIRTTPAGFISQGLALDGVSGVTSAPEPEAWVLAILGFMGLAIRLKAVRARGDAPTSARSPALALQSNSTSA